MNRKHTAIVLMIVVAIPLLAIAAWQKTSTRSNGVTLVEIVAAPGTGTNRIVTANGGVRVFNGWTNTVHFYIREIDGVITNTLDYVELSTNDLYRADWVHILDATDNSIKLDCVEACGNGLFIYTQYRDEAQ